jgi:hypothetical protein
VILGKACDLIDTHQQQPKPQQSPKHSEKPGKGSKSGKSFQKVDDPPDVAAGRPEAGARPETVETVSHRMPSSPDLKKPEKSADEDDDDDYESCKLSSRCQFYQPRYVSDEKCLEEFL